MYTFDTKSLEQALRGLDHSQRVLFALLCAERIFPAYSMQREFHKREISEARWALDEMWNSFSSSKAKYPIKYAEHAENYLRGEDAEWHPLNPIADNAIAAVLYACKCFITGDVDAAKWAAVQSYEAADFVAHTLGRVEFGTVESEKVISRLVLVQDELVAQKDDIADIKNGKCLVHVINELRSRSQEIGLRLAESSRTLI